MTVVVGSDHAGLELKNVVAAQLAARGVEVRDVGTHTSDSCDYPRFAKAVGQAVATSNDTVGILVCGTGMGMAIAANKLPGVRAALCTTELVARLSRQHNDANVLCLGARITGSALALAIVDAFLETKFDGGRHAKRVAMIHDLEVTSKG